jgi:hypothetical protein
MEGIGDWNGYLMWSIIAVDLSFPQQPSMWVTCAPLQVSNLESITDDAQTSPVQETTSTAVSA